jgi:hypothetical protein
MSVMLWMRSGPSREEWSIFFTKISKEMLACVVSNSWKIRESREERDWSEEIMFCWKSTSVLKDCSL